MCSAEIQNSKYNYITDTFFLNKSVLIMPYPSVKEYRGWNNIFRNKFSTVF